MRRRGKGNSLVREKVKERVCVCVCLVRAVYF